MNVERPRTLGVLLSMAMVSLSSPAPATPIPDPERNGSGEIGATLPIPTWEAPRFFQPPAARSADKSAPAVSSVAASSTPLVFVAVTPCRVLDTRGGTPPNPAYGYPNLSNLATREFQVTGSCGIPSGAGAVSANATITLSAGPGFLALWEGGGTAWPNNSTMNWTAPGTTMANAAIIPLSSTGTISAMAYVPYGSQATDFILDVNGYYTSDPNSGPFVKYGGATGSVPTNLITPLTWPTAISVSADAAGLVTNGTNWSFRAPKAGVYEVAVKFNFFGTWGPITAFAQIVPMVNGAPTTFMGGRLVPANTTQVVIMDGVAYLVVLLDDVISIGAHQVSGAAVSVGGAAGLDNWVTIRFVRPFP
jgi:hypothetical protein